MQSTHWTAFHQWPYGVHDVTQQQRAHYFLSPRVWFGIYFPFLCFSLNSVHARRHMNSLIFWCAVASASSSCYWCANCVSPNSPIVTASFGLRTENFRVENFSMSFHCLFRSRCIRYSIVCPCLIAYARETNFQNGWTMSTQKLRRRRRGRRRLCHAMIEIR